MDSRTSISLYGALDDAGRSSFETLLARVGGSLHVFVPHPGAGRTWTLVSLPNEEAAEFVRRALPPTAGIDVPPLAIFEVLPDRARDLAPLVHALAGPGAPVGVKRTAIHPSGIVVELDTAVTRAAFFVACVDALTGRRGREIRPLLPLGDADLADLAGYGMQEPHLDASRILEPYVERWIAEHPA